MKKFSKQLSQTSSSLDLVLPDSDFVTQPDKISLSQALLLNEQAKAWFPQSLPTDEERCRERVDIEFKL
jgi:hypothetical protein